jgi:class 3 adenylate cyclase/tetratricopeptide (TPR) repeat protein
VAADSLPGAPEGTVTVLFTDIERSTALLEQMGDKSWTAALSEHDRLVRQQVLAHRGFEVKSVGDGFMVAFSSARRAISCAIAIQRTIPSDSPMGVRIGLHTGEAVRRGSDFFGKTVVLAARIAGIARAGEILISSLLYELVASSGDFIVGAGREVRLKGLTGTYVVHEVDWRNATAVDAIHAVTSIESSPQPAAVEFVQEGDYWTISSGATQVRVRDGKGIRYLAELVARRGQHVHAIDLAADPRSGSARRPDVAELASAGLSVGGLGDAGELLDAEAKAAYRRRVAELEEEIEHARSWSDPERERQARDELAFVARELGAAVGLGGRDRRAASAAERARVNVTRAIRGVIARVREYDEQLGEHLDGAVRTGTFCCYSPPITPTAAPSDREAPERVAASANVEASPRVQPPFPRLLQVQDGRFVGRGAERAWLDERWRAAGAGGPPGKKSITRLVMLAGEPGIGKTSLAGEIARVAHSAGASVLYGRCHEENLIPYQPFVEALRHYFGALPSDRLRAELMNAGGELARIMPELADQLPGRPVRAYGEADGAPADPDGERYRLFEAIAGCLTRAARSNPLLLVLDDLHWADQPTLLALKYLARSPDPPPMLIVATYRSTEHPTRRLRLTETLADLRREELFERLSLVGLDVDAVLELIDSWAGRAPTREFAEMVRQETEGNPFFIQQVLRHLADSGAIIGEDSGRLSFELPIHELGVPEGVKEVVGRRLAALSESARAALGVASVIGREFRLAVLEEVCGLGADALLDVLEEALAANLIEELTDQAGYSFSHGLVRETLYDQLSAMRRARLHRRIGEVVRALAGPEPTPYLGALAHHFYEAGRDGDMSLAIEYAALAGDEAGRRLAYEEAVAHYQRGLQALDRMPGGSEARRCELLLSLGEASWRAGLLEPAKESFRAAATLAEKLADSRALARAALGYGLGEAVVQFDVGRVDPIGNELLELALARLREEDSGLRARIMSHLSNELALTSERERSVTLAEQAVAMARRLGDPGTLAFVLMKTYPSLWRPDDAERRLAVLTEIAELATGLGDQLRVVQAHVWGLACALELGDAAALAREQQLVGELTSSVRVPYAKWVAALVVALRAQLEGRLAEVEVLAQSALELGREANTETAAQLFAVQILLLRRDQGRMAELASVFDDVVERYSAVWAWRAAAATFYGELGDLQRARQALAELGRAGLRNLPVQFTWSVGMFFLAEGCWLVSDQRLAAEAYELLLPYRDRCAVVPHSAFIGPIEGTLGSLAATVGKLELAGEHFARAIAKAAALGAAAIAANLQERYARVLIEMGGDEARVQAAELATLARETAEPLGMTALLGRLDTLLVGAS